MAQQTHTDQQPLSDMQPLSELRNYDLVNEHEDVRGRTLVTSDGQRLGVIENMMVDRDRKRIAALVLDNGRTVPIESVRVNDREVILEGAPEIAASSPDVSVTQGAKGDDNELHVPIVEEELTVGKRAVESGRILVRSRVVEEPVSEEVRLRKERISVEERAINQPVDNPDALFREEDIEVTATSEEPVIAKRATVKEEIVIRKNVEELSETLQDTVRHTEVDVDPHEDGTKQ